VNFEGGSKLAGASGSRDEAEAERLERALGDVEREISQLKRITAANRELDLTPQIASLESRAGSLREEIARDPTAWQTVQLARDPARPKVMDYVAGLMSEFIELHGDRRFRDDPAIVAGLGLVDGRPAALIGHAKGRDTRENIERNFGSPHPEGYRKAARIMRLAEKLRLPLITLIDTQGAAPGKEAEERGQSEAIASTLLVLARVRTPVVTVITGEGGSGGALAIGIGDVVLMLDKAVYSVISPEGCAAIPAAHRSRPGRPRHRRRDNRRAGGGCPAPSRSCGGGRGRGGATSPRRAGRATAGRASGCALRKIPQHRPVSRSGSSGGGAPRRTRWCTLRTDPQGGGGRRQ